MQLIRAEAGESLAQSEIVGNRGMASGPLSPTSVLTTRGVVDTGQRNMLASGSMRQLETEENPLATARLA